MIGSGDYSDDDWWTNVFGGKESDPIEQRRIRYLLQSNYEKDMLLRDLRGEIGKTRAQIRRLKEASMSFLGPVMLVGIVGFVEAYRRSSGAWEVIALLAAAAFGFWWLRNVGKAFDDVKFD